MKRPAHIQHCTSEALHFFGRQEELTLLDQALAGGSCSVLALIGPGGQGKTAIVQHWLDRLPCAVDGLFFWSFYRGKEPDLCLRELYAYASARSPSGVSASYCVDTVLPILRQERWVMVFDGIEVVQHEKGSWFGRIQHPELARFLEELAGESLPGVAIITSRFDCADLSHRKHFRAVWPGGLDNASSRHLLESFGVHGAQADIDAAIAACRSHPKAVELLGVYLSGYRGGSAAAWTELPDVGDVAGASPEEIGVLRVVAALDAVLEQHAKDILALATSFRDPPTEECLVEYLLSESVQSLVTSIWRRTYPPFAQQGPAWIGQQIQQLVVHRLLERVGVGTLGAAAPRLDAHPLVRRAFDHSAGESGRSANALARAGFLSGRPDRRAAVDLAQAGPEIELFHAYCDAGLWLEADSAFAALQNPKYRFLAPGLERDLLCRFFPEGDFKRPPLWSGFARYRSLAICFEMLGDYRAALDCYRGADVPLRGDALLAVGDLATILSVRQAAAPWSNLWQAYRIHALCLAGRVEESLAAYSAFVPVDVYEWLHVFEAWLRAGALARLDLSGIFQQNLERAEHDWSRLAWQRMQIDYSRKSRKEQVEIEEALRRILEAYDAAGLPWERCLTRLSLARWLADQGRLKESNEVTNAIENLANQHGFVILLRDALSLKADVALAQGLTALSLETRGQARLVADSIGCLGPTRP
ncbi:MAG TPA: ATP-binding protein [Gemmataceae bacterium]|jgi:tetratricopeptide (TPR) repeat protein|nr:ATP-binding protein [Gemmataceae bacterium]